MFIILNSIEIYTNGLILLIPKNTTKRFSILLILLSNNRSLMK